MSELSAKRPRLQISLRPKLPVEFVLLNLADQKVGIGVRCSGVAKQRVSEINTAERKEAVRGTAVTLAQAGLRVNMLVEILMKLLASDRFVRDVVLTNEAPDGSVMHLMNLEEQIR